MLRCAYRGETKVVWDSHGNVEVFRYDSDEECWQRQPDEDALPEWAGELFDDELVTYGGDGAEAEDVDLDDATKNRLQDLGYL